MLGHELLWGYLVHLSFNLWSDREIPDDVQHSSYKPDFFFDDSLWSDVLREMAEAGINMVVIDLGDGVIYESHPEIAVNDAWTVDHLRDELDKMRGMGLEPVPKLNFSTCHDVWLAQYSRCVSTDAYYDVCRDLIAEVIEIFNKPRFFHLGMDEETLFHQRHHNYVVIHNTSSGGTT